MSALTRKQFILVIMGAMVFFSMIDFFFYHPTTRSIATEFQTWAIIISSLALGIGVIKMIFLHGNYVIRRESDRIIPSSALLIALVLTLISGVIDLNLGNPVFKFMYTNVYQVLHGAVYGLTGFYITSAIYKAYRVRSYESLMLLVAGIIMLLKNAPIGEFVLGTSIVSLGDWLMAVPNTAGNLAILIGFAVGTILLSLRIILGLERGVTGGAAE
jgi:hypothetical protein